MQNREDFLQNYRKKHGSALYYNDDELYNIYIHLREHPRVHEMEALKYIEEEGIDVTYLTVRTYYANRGVEFTPQEVKEWLNVVMMIREEGN